MRGPVGGLLFLVLCALGAAPLLAAQARVNARLAHAEAQLAMKEASVGLTPGPLVEAGAARRDWRATFGPSGHDVSGVRQQAELKAQTERFLAGEPWRGSAAREERRAAARAAQELTAKR